MLQTSVGAYATVIGGDVTIGTVIYSDQSEGRDGVVGGVGAIAVLIKSTLA